MGMARQHEDAGVIGGLIERHAIVVSASPVSRQSLGRGERAILDLLAEKPAASIVTDDQAFIALLRRSGVNFVTPEIPRNPC